MGDVRREGRNCGGSPLHRQTTVRHLVQPAPHEDAAEAEA
jgi:hypothetical protein